MPARIARMGDVWAGALGKAPTARTLGRAMEALEKTLAAE
jgi:hypothetical protein